MRTRFHEREAEAKKRYRERHPEKHDEWRQKDRERKRRRKRGILKVEVEPLRTAIGQKDLWEIADRLGWYDERGTINVKRLRRRLKQNHISYELAIAITEAANLDPVDVGL